MSSGVSPFHQPGAGRLTSTVSWPALAGVKGIEPFSPVSSQLPIMSAAEAIGAAANVIATASALPRTDSIVVLNFMTLSRSCVYRKLFGSFKIIEFPPDQPAMQKQQRL